MWNVLRGNNTLLSLLLFSWLASAATASVSYDHKAIIINGQKRILISGSIHYPRSTPEVPTMPMWFIAFFLFFLIFIYYLWWYFNAFLTYGFFLVFVCVVTDVAWFNTEVQRWRLGCYSDLCVLEWAWAFSRKSNAIAF